MLEDVFKVIEVEWEKGENGKRKRGKKIGWEF